MATARRERICDRAVADARFPVPTVATLSTDLERAAARAFRFPSRLSARCRRGPRATSPRQIPERPVELEVIGRVIRANCCRISCQLPVVGHRRRASAHPNQQFVWRQQIFVGSVRAAGHRSATDTLAGAAALALPFGPNPLAPIRVCIRWILAVDARRLPSAFDPNGQTGALVQTRERERAAAPTADVSVAQSRVVGCGRRAIALPSCRPRRAIAMATIERLNVSSVASTRTSFHLSSSP